MLKVTDTLTYDQATLESARCIYLSCPAPLINCGESFICYWSEKNLTFESYQGIDFLPNDLESIAFIYVFISLVI